MTLNQLNCAVGSANSKISEPTFEIIEYHLSEEEIICPKCFSTLHVMSKEVSRELKIMPAPVLRGSLVSPSFMAFVMNRKFVEVIPLNRQEQ